ncbi:hypothetical protein WS69_20860 [Burkholderia sp. BDU5]|nr:hypothetical protein WS69_20860 [Burkholderia sp. BDU5]
MANDRWRTANGERRTANGERRTANGERRTANGAHAACISSFVGMSQVAAGAACRAVNSRA